MTTELTGITVVYNTKDLIDRAVQSIRKFYPHLTLIIVNNSTPGHECDKYLQSRPYENCLILSAEQKGIMPYNIGHGQGMHLALSFCKTKQALVFDSDTEMIKGGSIEAMQGWLPKNAYGIGEICYSNDEGQNDDKGFKYLHPYYMLLNIKQYHKYYRFVHHGAPCYKAMKELNDKGKSDLLYRFLVRDYIKHDWKGTRKLNPPEFLKDWE